ncbi:MAG: hypothetical protein NVS1B2_15870 [Vulcanimicrobiaceae bacterium]
MSYAPEEKFALAEGVEWTREQVVTALRDANAKAPMFEEAQGFQKLFGGDLKAATENWAPILQRLNTEPNLTAFLDAALGDPQRLAYLEACSAHYDTEVAPPVAARAPATDPAMAREFAQMRAELNSMRDDRQAALFQTHMSQATAKYPMLASNAALRNDLIETTRGLRALDPNKTILDALALKASIYDALSIAHNAPRDPEPALVAPPALLGSPGAAPNGARPSQNRNQKFESPDAALDAWLAADSQKYS